jgi:hypothetical protein
MHTVDRRTFLAAAGVAAGACLLPKERIVGHEFTCTEFIGSKARAYPPEAIQFPTVHPYADFRQVTKRSGLYLQLTENAFVQLVNESIAAHCWGPSPDDKPVCEPVQYAEFDLGEPVPVEDRVFRRFGLVSEFAGNRANWSNVMECSRITPSVVTTAVDWIFRQTLGAVTAKDLFLVANPLTAISILDGQDFKVGYAIDPIARDAHFIIPDGVVLMLTKDRRPESCPDEPRLSTISLLWRDDPQGDQSCPVMLFPAAGVYIQCTL